MSASTVHKIGPGRKRVCPGLRVLILLILGLWAVPVVAQESQLPPDAAWSELARISTNAGAPVLVGDPSGELHLFYVEGDYAEDVEPWEQAVMYLHGDGQAWSRPVDVLVSPHRTRLTVNAVLIDDGGFLHLLWNDQQALYHSAAHVDGAANPQRWRTTMVWEGPIPIADLASGPSGVLHALVRTDYFTASHFRSDDGGRTWSQPVQVAAIDLPEQYAIGGVKLAVAEADTIHATWFQTAAEAGWNFWSVWYGRSTDGGRTWELVDEVAAPLFGASDVAVDGEGYVHLVWGRNIGQPDGRWHAWSEDGGESWSEPQLLFPQFESASGDTGGYGFALDSAGTLHLANSFSEGGGADAAAYYLAWQGDGWSEPLHLMDLHAHFARLAVTQGNRLHFVAMGRGNDLWYRASLSGAPPVEAAPLPTAPAVGMPATDVPAEPQATASPQPSVTPGPSIVAPGQPPASASNPLAPLLANPLLVGLLPVILLIAAVVLLKQAANRRPRR